MAGGRGVKAGDAFVLLGLKYDDKALKELEKGRKLTNLGGALTTVGQYATIAFSLLGAAIGIAANEAGKYDAEMQRLSMIYGNLAKSQMEWMNTMRDTSRRGKLQTLEMVNMYGAVAKGLELNSDQAIIFSRAMSQVTSNFATFTKLPLQEAMLRIRSALSGSGEVLDIYGINVKQAALDQEMLRLGFKTTSQGASELEKTFARATIIMRALQSQGAANADLFMNTLPRSYDIAKGRLSNMLIEMGNAFLPAAVKVTEVVGGLAGAVAYLGKIFRPVIAVVGIASLGLLGMLSTVGLLGIAFVVLGQGITAMQAAYVFWQQHNTLINSQLITQNILVGSLTTKIALLGFSIAAITIGFIGLINAISEAADAESQLGKFRDYNKEHPVANWMESLNRWAVKVRIILREVSMQLMHIVALWELVTQYLTFDKNTHNAAVTLHEAEKILDDMRTKLKSLYDEMNKIPTMTPRLKALQEESKELQKQLDLQKRHVKFLDDKAGYKTYSQIREEQRKDLEAQNEEFRRTQRAQEGVDRREATGKGGNELPAEEQALMDMIKEFKSGLAAGTAKVKVPTALEYGTKAAMQTAYGVSSIDDQMLEETKKQTAEIKRQTEVIEEAMGDPTMGYPETPQAKPQYQGV